MSDTFIPPAGSEAGAALRSGFSVSAVEAALTALAGAAVSGLEFHAGALPDEADGVGISVAELPEPEEPYLGRRHAVAVCAGRSAVADFPALFSALAAGFPAAEREAGGIRFHSISQKGTCRFAETLHHGRRKRTAELTLLCEIDLTQSSFSAPPEAQAVTPEMWAAIRPVAVEAALAGRLGVVPGPLPADDAGKRLRLTGGSSLSNPEWRDFSFEITVRAPGHTEAARELAALLDGFPAERVSAGGVLFNAVWQEGSAAYEPGTLLDRSCVLARATLAARVNTVGSQGVSDAVPAADPNRSVTVFDPASLERALAARIAGALGLELDRELCRGEFPPPAAGTAIVAAVRLLGVASGNRETGWNVTAQLRLRAPHRDDLFRRILAFDALFPRYDDTLGGFPLRAMLKRGLALDWKEENGRNIIAADLTLELIL